MCTTSVIVLSLVFGAGLFPFSQKFVQSTNANNVTGECSETLDGFDGNVSFSHQCRVENCTAVLKCKSDASSERDRIFICSASTGEYVWVVHENGSDPMTVNCSRNVSEILPTLSCEHPADLFQNGLYTMEGNGTTLKYNCTEGFRLVGTEERHCNTGNRTWSGELPQCIAAPNSSTEKASESFNWIKTFADRKRWRGVYGYHEKQVTFSLLVNSSESSQVLAVFKDGAAEFELTGIERNSNVVFNLTRMLHPSNTFPMNISWSVKGSMITVEPCCEYKGRVDSSHLGFAEFTMSSSSNDEAAVSPESGEEDDDGSGSPSFLAMVLGITIAFVAVLLAGFLATYCVRRNGTLRQGHQTLTSFENPIYDCENVLK